MQEVDVYNRRNIAVACRGAENKSCAGLGAELLLRNGDDKTVNVFGLVSSHQAEGSWPKARRIDGRRLWIHRHKKA